MSKIINLNTQSFEEQVLKEKGIVLVDFWAEWCGPCKMLGPILEELSQETDIKIYKVDVDSNPEITSNFKIRSIPTMIIFKDGVQIDNLIGFKSKDEIAEKLKTY
ncbi:MAG: thioredoxin [Fusobacteriaceae bacterium]